MSSSSSPPCSECQDLQKEFDRNPGGKKFQLHRTGLALVAATGGAALALSAVCLPFVTPALRRFCLPYVPATSRQVDHVLRALKGRQGQLVDIGSGDGRIVLATAQAGFQSHGIELNPWLVLYSRWRSWRTGLRGRATFARQDLWKSDLGQFQNVVIFGVEEMMPELESKLTSELSCVSGAPVVVACRFPFPTWKPTATIGEGIDSVWLYQMGNTTTTHKEDKKK